MKSLRCAAIALLITSCSSQSAPDSLDIYYRPFSATSIARLSESDMLTSAGNAGRVTDKSEISGILQHLPSACDPSDVKESEMDLRVLIYLNFPKKREKWKAGQFSYYDSRSGKMCKMTQALQEQVEASLPGFRT